VSLHIDINIDVNILSLVMSTRRPRSPSINGRSAKRTATIRVVQGLRRIVKALETYSQEVRAVYGLTGPQLWALKTLQRQGEMSIGELAAALAVHQSSVSLLVTRLERQGLARRSRGGSDRRFVAIELTRRGSALAADAPEPAQGRLLHSLQAMSATEVREIGEAVDRLVGAMEATDVKVRFFFSDD
jgi:DNA-binding MarR family transcriptional regulator